MVASTDTRSREGGAVRATDETVTLCAASYRLVCPGCGRTGHISRLARFVECGGCGAMIITDPRPQHGFGEGDAAQPGALRVASYRWQCPDCTQVHYEPQARPTVRCPQCGAAFEVAAAQHNGPPQMRLL